MTSNSYEAKYAISWNVEKYFFHKIYAKYASILGLFCKYLTSMKLKDACFLEEKLWPT